MYRWGGVVLTLVVGCQAPVVVESPNNVGVSIPPDPGEGVQVERFVNAHLPADILFLVRGSPSLDYPARLVEAFPTLRAGLQGVDHHIGVTAMTLDSGEVGELYRALGRPYIDASMDAETAATAFELMIEQTDGEFDSEGRGAAYATIELLSDIPENENFYRRASGTLQLVFVSPEDDESGANPLTRFEFRHWLAEGAKSNVNPVVANTIVSPDASEEFRRYSAWSDGENLDIDAADWAPFMERVAERSIRLARDFHLAQLPRFDTLDVRVIDPQGVRSLRVCRPSWNDPDCEVEYTPVPNRISLLDDTPAGAEIRVTYEPL